MAHQVVQEGVLWRSVINKTHATLAQGKNNNGPIMLIARSNTGLWELKCSSSYIWCDYITSCMEQLRINWLSYNLNWANLVQPKHLIINPAVTQLLPHLIINKVLWIKWVIKFNYCTVLNEKCQYKMRGTNTTH